MAFDSRTVRVVAVGVKEEEEDEEGRRGSGSRRGSGAACGLEQPAAQLIQDHHNSYAALHSPGHLACLFVEVEVLEKRFEQRTRIFQRRGEKVDFDVLVSHEMHRGVDGPCVFRVAPLDFCQTCDDRLEFGLGRSGGGG